MGKHKITERCYSQQPNRFYIQQERTFFLFQHLNTTIHRNTNVSFRPLATSTPYDIEQSYCDSPHSVMKHQRPLLNPPIFSSTPKQTHRQGTTSSSKRKIPIVISQRRLQFTKNSQSFAQQVDDRNRRTTMKNVKIWLL